MVDQVTFRTTDLTRWGTGQNSKLNKTQIDINFWVLLSRLMTVEHQAVAAAVGIHDFFIDTLDPTKFFVSLTDGTQLGPFALPQQTWNFTNPPSGAWVANSLYHVNDVFLYASILYVANIEHTSASSFDPNLQISAANVYSVLLNVASVQAQPDITTTTYTVGILDANTYMRFTNGAGCAITIPADTFPLYTELMLRDETGISFGGISVSATSPGAINGVRGYSNTSQTNGATIALKQVASNSWDIMGLLLSA